MNHTIWKQPPIRLDEESYRKLRKAILRRDSWKCQACGAMTNLEVHHKRFRSQAGEDTEQNLITLCFDCHAQAHRPTTTRGLLNQSGAARIRGGGSAVPEEIA